MKVTQDTHLKLNFVDLAGHMTAGKLIEQQKKFSYILLCYAINNRQSYEQLDDWIDAINQNPRGERTPIALVATKRDLSNDRKVTEDQGFDYLSQLVRDSNQTYFSADRQRCSIFLETSAFEDVDSVTSLFRDITNDIVRNKIFDDTLMDSRDATTNNDMRQPLLKNNRA